MKVLNDDNEKVVIEFSKREYYQIQDWLTGKNALETDLEVRDTLETFLHISSYMNPNDDIKEYIKPNPKYK